MNAPAPETSSEDHRLPIRLNLLVTVVTQGCATVLSLITMPVFLRFMGVEAIGLLTFIASLQGAMRMLDLGISMTLTRELARLQATPSLREEADRLYVEIERLFFYVGVVVVAVFAAASPLIVNHLHSKSTLGDKILFGAVLAAGIQCALNWIFSLYQSALIALERHLFVSGLRMIEVVVGIGGAVVLVACFEGGVVGVLLWQSGITALCGVLASWKLRPRHVTAGGGWKTAIKTWRGAWEMSLLWFTATVFSLMDKIILGTTLPLRSFGEYSIAISVATAMAPLVVAPIFNITLPRFTHLLAQRRTAETVRVFQASQEFLAAMAIPFAALLWAYGRELVFCWTGDAAVASDVAPLVRLLGVSCALNTLMVPVFTLQLAAGWTAMVIRFNIASMLVLAPLLFFSSRAFGAIGGAWVMMIFNATYLLIMLPLTIMRAREKLGDAPSNLPSVVLLAVCAAFVFLVEYFQWTLPTGRFTLLATLMAIGAGLASIGFLISRDLREQTLILLHTMANASFFRRK